MKENVGDPLEYDCTGQPIEPGFWESMVPIVGTYKSMMHNLSQGNWFMAAVDAVTLGAELTGVGAVFTSAAKMGMKVLGKAASMATKGYKAAIKATKAMSKTSKTAANSTSKLGTKSSRRTKSSTSKSTKTANNSVKKNKPTAKKKPANPKKRSASNSKRNSKQTKKSQGESPKNVNSPKGTGCFVAGTTVITPEGQKNIEDIQVGDRVTTDAEEVTGEISEQDIDEEDMLLITLQGIKADGGRVIVQTLRSKDDVAELKLEVGSKIDFDTIEIGFKGLSTITAIESSPELKDGPGRLVLTTFKHEAKQVFDLYIEGQDEPITGTGYHPFWSVDRQEFIALEELHPGENLLALNGQVEVRNVSQRGPPARVYNFEVEGEHVYRVSQSGILVHNSCNGNAPKRVKNINKPSDLRPSTKYDKFSTGKDYEEVWELADGTRVRVDGVNGEFVVEAKWTGNPRQWNSSPYNPAHEFYNEAKILDQAKRLLDLQSQGGFKSLNYAISNPQGRAHFEKLFKTHFPDAIQDGRLKIWNVDGAGM